MKVAHETKHENCSTSLGVQHKTSEHAIKEKLSQSKGYLHIILNFANAVGQAAKIPACRPLL